MKTPLRYVAEMNQQVLPESTPPEFRFKYIDISQVSSLGEISIPNEYTSFESAPSRARRVAAPGDTVVSTVRTYLRAIATVPNVDDRLVFSTGFAVLSPRGVDPRFLGYACRSSQFVHEVVARSVGVSYPAIAPSDLLDIPVWTPPHDSQRRVADFLDDRVSRIDRIIAARREQMATLRAWHNASMREITETAGHPSRPTGVHWHPTVAKDWSFPRVAQAFHTGSGSTPPSDNVDYYGGAIPWVTTGDVRDAGLSTTAKTVTELAIAEFSTLALYPPGTLLVAMYGQGKTKGRVALLETQAAVNQACCAIQGPPSRTEWAFFWFRAHKSAVVELANGSGQPNLSQDIVRSIRLPLPSEPERHRLLSRLRELDREVAAGLQAAEAQVRLWMEYKSSMITAAVTGELDVSTVGSSIPG